MKQLDLRYVAHVTTLSHVLRESYATTAATIRQLVAELDARYPGFQTLFVNRKTHRLNLNAMIYYSDPGEIPISVIDIEHPISDGGTVTFW